MVVEWEGDRATCCCLRAAAVRAAPAAARAAAEGAVAEKAEVKNAAEIWWQGRQRGRRRDESGGDD